MNKTITKIFIAVLLVSSSLHGSAQSLHGSEHSVQTPKTKQKDTSGVSGYAKNLIKLNLTALPLNNYSVIYERAIGKKIAAGIGLRYMPEDQLPFLDALESSIDDADTFNQLKDFKTGNVAITPEIKFYFGKDVFRGFYIAPFVRYAQYTGSMPFDFEYDDDNNAATPDKPSKIDLDGKINAITGGLLFGAQWKLSKLVYLDWSILGPSYGSSKGSITGATAELSKKEVREGLEEEFQELEDSDIPLVKIKTSVNDKEARADFSGPWAGVRASISIGFRF